MKQTLDYKKLLITLSSIVLFYLIGRYGKITTGIHITYIYLQYPLLCIISIIYGPIIGAITGIVGHMMIDIENSSFVWYSWVLGSGFLGFSLGYVSNKWKLKDLPKDDKKSYGKTRLIYALVILGLNIVSFLIIAPTLEMIFYKATFEDAFSRGLFIAFSNGLTSAVLTDVFFSSLRHTALRRIVSIITLIDALVLVSYGNMNIGSIFLYIITIAFALYLFFYNRLHIKSKNKFIKGIKIAILGIFAIYACEVLFLAVFAYANRVAGDEKIAIVLGAGLEGEEPSTILQLRLDTAYDWYMEDPERIIVTSGGQGDDEIIPEGQAMFNYLVDKGVPAKNILVENSSTTTFENFQYSFDLLKDNDLIDDSNIVIVTNNFHCFRASGYAHKAGFDNVKTLAAPTPVYGIIPNYLRESIAFMKYLFS